MAEQDFTRLCREYVEVFNKGDWQRYKEMLTPDTVYEEFGTQRRIQGADQIVDADRAWKEAFPDAEGKISNICSSGSMGCIELTWEGTHRGTLMGPEGNIPATGKRASVRAALFLTFEGDKVKECRHYFDLMTLLQQIGVGTPVGARSR